MSKKIKAAILDLDGVITQTAKIHASAWKKMFDLYNDQRKKEGKEAYKDFSIENDYPKYLDGLPRYDGVKNFLDSRGTSLPYGDKNDKPGSETICGLGNWKNELFNQLVKEKGAEAYPDTINKINEWRERGIKTAVISSSKNCKLILESIGIEHLFDTRIDGIVSAERNIKGKPAPDIFLEAAKELNTDPKDALIVEDALGGVEAGSKGGFAIVVGITRGGVEKEKLKEHGADIVIDSFDELHI